MHKKLLPLALAGLLLNVTAAGPAHAQSRTEKEARRVERVRAKIMKLGTGESARVRIRLRDKKKVKGYVREAGEETFDVCDARTGGMTTIPYSQVKTINERELSLGAKLAFPIMFGFLLIVASLTAKGTS